MDKTASQYVHLNEVQITKIIRLLEDIRNGIEYLADAQLAKTAALEYQANPPFPEDRYDPSAEDDSVPF